MQTRILAVAMCALSTTGCAFLFKGTKQDVEFTSVPGESDVRVENRYMGATPTTVPINRNAPPNVVVSKDGYKEQYVRIDKHPDVAWWFWDIATCVVPVTLCIPVLFDALSGAWMSVDDKVRVKLDTLPMATPAPRAAPPPPPAEPTNGL